nr:hypothetical protein CFP56_03322 [Quercus suber]
MDDMKVDDSLELCRNCIKRGCDISEGGLALAKASKHCCQLYTDVHANSRGITYLSKTRMAETYERLTSTFYHRGCIRFTPALFLVPDQPGEAGFKRVPWHEHCREVIANRASVNVMNTVVDLLYFIRVERLELLMSSLVVASPAILHPEIRMHRARLSQLGNRKCPRSMSEAAPQVIETYAFSRYEVLTGSGVNVVGSFRVHTKVVEHDPDRDPVLICFPTVQTAAVHTQDVYPPLSDRSGRPRFCECIDEYEVDSG